MPGEHYLSWSFYLFKTHIFAMSISVDKTVVMITLCLHQTQNSFKKQSLWFDGFLCYHFDLNNRTVIRVNYIIPDNFSVESTHQAFWLFILVFEWSHCGNLVGRMLALQCVGGRGLKPCRFLSRLILVCTQWIVLLPNTMHLELKLIFFWLDFKNGTIMSRYSWHQRNLTEHTAKIKVF